MKDIPDFLRLMYDLTPEQRLECGWELNRWQWPECLAQYKPEGHDSLKQFNKEDHDDPNTLYGHPHRKALWDAVDIVTTEWQRSWHHNAKSRGKKYPGMTAERHRAWWKENYKS